MSNIYKRLFLARISRRITLLLLACLEVFPAKNSAAATLTWTGLAGNGNLLTSANWTPAQTPATGDKLIFANSTSLTATFGSTALTVSSVTFDATAGAFVLSGTSTLTISSSAGITTNSTALETINSNLALTTSQTWTANTGSNLVVNGNIAEGSTTLSVNGAGNISLGGILSGTGGLSKTASTSTGILTLNGANTYSGTTSLSNGTVQVANDRAFGTGTVSFNGSKIEALGGARTFANNLVLGGTLTTQGAYDLTFNGTASLTSSRSITTNGTGLTTLNGVISQSSSTARSLSKSGIGTLVLNGSNTYTGGTTLSAGVLQLGNNNAAGTGTLSLGTGTLQTGSVPLTLANTISFAGNTTFAGIQDMTLNGTATLSGTRTWTLSNTGKLVLNGAIGQTSAKVYGFIQKGGSLTLGGIAPNTFTGTTAVYDGSLFLSKSGGQAFGAGLQVGDGVGAANSAVVQLTAAGQFPTTASTLAVNADGQLNLQTFGASITTSTFKGGSVVGTGTLSLGGTLTFSGTGGVATTIAAPVTLNAARTFSIADNGVVDLDTSLSGIIANGSATGSITKTGTGTLFLSAANTFTGGVSVNAGSLQLGHNSALGTGAINLGDTTGSSTASLLFNTSTGLTVSNAIASRTGSSGTLTLGGLNTSGTNIFSGNIALNRGISVTAAAGGQVDLTGVISGAGGLSKTGAGTVRLTNTNTYTGGTVLSAGTLLLGANNALGAATGNVTVTAGTLDFGTNNNATVGALTLTSGSILGSGTSTLTTSGTMSVSSGTISVALAGTGGLTKSTAGSVVLGGADIFSGATSITAGTLAAGTTGAFSPNSAVTLSTGAILDLRGFHNTVASLAGTGNVALGSGTLTVGGNNAGTTFSGVVGGTGGLTKNGTGTLIINGVNTYTGATIINGGTLQFGLSNTINSASAVTIASNSTLSLANFSGTFGSIAGAGNISQGSGPLAFGGDNSSSAFSGIISGTGTVTKNGGGTTTLTGTNTTTGALVLTGGKTTLSGTNGSLASAASVTLRSGAILDLDNANTENSNRIGNSAGITLNGGILRLLSDNNGTTETVGALTVAAGDSTIVIAHNGTTANSTRLTFSSLGTISNGATVNFSATGGILGAEAFGPQIFITGRAYGLLGGWATVGADPAEYSAYGIRANGDYYEGVIGLNYNSLAEIVRISSTSLSPARTLSNAGVTTDLGLNLTGDASVSLGTSSTRTLNLAGGFLSSSTTTPATISGAGVLTAGGSAGGNLAISVTDSSSLTISSVIANNAIAAVGLSKAGTGSLTLSGANTFTGNVFLNGGTTNISSEANLGATGNDVTLSGGTLHLTSGFTTSVGKLFTVIANQMGTLDVDSAQTLTLANTAGILASGNSASTLLKNGAGSLIIQNANTAFTGTLQINSGRAELRDSSSLAGAIALNGGVLALVNNVSTTFGNNLAFLSDSTVHVDRLSGGGAVTHTIGAINLGSSIWTISGANSAALSVGTVTLTGNATFNPTTADLATGAISGLFGFTKTGAGTLLLNADSSYTGATTVNTGTLRLGSNNALPATTDLTVASGATFDLADRNATTASLAGAGNVTLSSNLSTGTNSSTFSGSLSGVGALTKIGSGTLTLTGANSYTGVTTINAGTLSLGGLNRLSASTAVTIATGATFNLGGNTTIASLSGAGNVTLGSSTLTTGAGTSSFSGSFTGNGALIKADSGVFTLTGSSAYTGATNIDGGTLIVSNSTALGVAGGISLANGAELQLQGDITLPEKNLTSSGTLRNNSGDNTYSGNVALAGNTAIITDAGSLAVIGSVTFGGNTLAVTSNATTALTGDLRGAGSLTKSGSATLLLSGNNSYTGTTTVSAGTLQVDSANGLGAIGAGNSTSIASGATLLLDADGVGLNIAAETLNLSGTLRSVSGQNTWNGPITLAGGSLQVDSEILTLEGDISESGGSRSLIKSGNGLLLLSASAFHTGGTFITAGTLQLDSSDRLPSAGAVNVSASATLDLNDNNQTVGSIAGSGIIQTGPTSVASGGGTLTVGTGNQGATFSGTLQGAGDLVKTGTATQTLASASTFTGGTTINSGKLEASGTNALGTTESIEINSGGTLLLSGAGVTDRINNAATITLTGGVLARSSGSEGSGTSRSSSGVLSGSSSVGLGALTLAANSTLDFGTGAFGTLNFASFSSNGFTLNILNYSRSFDNSSVDGQMDRLIFDADQSGNLARFNFGSGFTPVGVNLGNGFYEVTAVPEPATWLGGIAMVGLTLSQLRRRRSRRI